MSEHDHGASEELAGLVLAGVDWTVRLYRTTVRLAVLVILALVVIGTPFLLWGLLVGWS